MERKKTDLDADASEVIFSDRFFVKLQIFFSLSLSLFHSARLPNRILFPRLSIIIRQTESGEERVYTQYTASILILPREFHLERRDNSTRRRLIFHSGINNTSQRVYTYYVIRIFH